MVGTSYLWLVGLFGAFFTHIASEVVLPIRSSYLEDVAKDEATMGYLGAMRQFASYGAQLLTVAVTVAFQLSVSGRIVHSQFIAIFSGIWFLIFMPFILQRFFRDYPAKRQLEPGQGSLCVFTFTSLSHELMQLKRYPEACKFLLVTAILQVGGPVVIVISSTFVTQALEMPTILFTVTTAMVLFIGLPASFALATALKTNCLTFRKAWFLVCIFFILIGGLTPALADGPNAKSWYSVIILAGLLGGIALSWFYSIGWSWYASLRRLRRAQRSMAERKPPAPGLDNVACLVLSRAAFAPWFPTVKPVSIRASTTRSIQSSPPSGRSSTPLSCSIRTIIIWHGF